MGDLETGVHSRMANDASVEAPRRGGTPTVVSEVVVSHDVNDVSYVDRSRLNSLSTPVSSHRSMAWPCTFRHDDRIGSGSGRASRPIHGDGGGHRCGVARSSRHSNWRVIGHRHREARALASAGADVTLPCATRLQVRAAADIVSGDPQRGYR